MDAAQNIAHDIQHGMESDGDQFLTFMLAGEEYGVDILRVQEIKGWDSVTPIPNTPDYIRGVINLRGTIVPIIDLRRRFHLEAVEYGPMTVVIVLKVENPETGKSRVMGLVVDAVSDVYNVPDDAIKAAPDFGSVVDVDFVRGLATLENAMVIVLDIDRLLNADEIATVERAAS
jgi:purine-binding chemotaxis protein CheW